MRTNCPVDVRISLYRKQTHLSDSREDNGGDGDDDDGGDGDDYGGDDIFGDDDDDDGGDCG
jgi:hypothetical protein